MAADPSLDELTAGTLAKAFGHIARTIPKMGTDRPKIGRADLTYERTGLNGWVDGFWPGQLWLAYGETGDGVFRAAAEAYRPYFADRLTRPKAFTHDFGFLYSLSAVAEWTLTGNGEARAMAIRAAEILAGRFNAAGRFIQAWNEMKPHEIGKPGKPRSSNAGRMIMDCMENLGLLYWAAADDRRFAEVADAHAETTLKHLIRPDFSTVHTFRFDPATGAPIGPETHQGYADNSCWSRGHAWAIHGFAEAHRHTGRRVYLDAARGLADYAIARLPADGVPVWDFLLGAGEPAWRDSSAGAIMASGLAHLAGLVGEAGAEYRAVSETILRTLAGPGYSLLDNDRAEGLLDHGASFVAMGRTDTMLPYGDYFFLETLLRHRGRTAFFW